MPNNYTPPSTIEFFNSSFTSSVIYYSSQASVFGQDVTNVSFVSLTSAFTANSITIPIPGDYFITTQTACILDDNSLSSTAPQLQIQWHITKAAQSDINVTDLAMTINTAADSTSGIIVPATFTRKVSFPVAGTWTLTPQAKINTAACAFRFDAGNTFWIVSVSGTNPMDVIDQQLTQFVDGYYTLMTNMDVNAQWNSLTEATVAGYATTLGTHASEIGTNTTNITALQVDVVDINTDIADIQNTLNTLTTVSTTGGVRIKP